MRNKLKVFIWDNCLTDYTSGIMFTVAESIEEARQQLLKECPHIPEYDLTQTPLIYELTDRPARAVWGGG